MAPSTALSTSPKSNGEVGAALPGPFALDATSGLADPEAAGATWGALAAGFGVSSDWGDRRHDAQRTIAGRTALTRE